jgi:hypothetical protein
MHEQLIMCGWISESGEPRDLEILAAELTANEFSAPGMRLSFAQLLLLVKSRALGSAAVRATFTLPGYLGDSTSSASQLPRLCPAPQSPC